MKPLLAVSILVLGIFHINVSSAYSDKAALGARLIRSLIKPKPKADEKTDGNKQTDTLSKEMKKQMKRIDALEDIFIGSSGSPGTKKIVKVKRIMITPSVITLDISPACILKAHSHSKSGGSI